MMQAPKFWQSKNVISCFLWPLSGVYYCALKLDRFIKRCNRYQSDLPVISVGNITVGGSGKSPVVAFIAEELIKQGEVVAILSRGYGVNISTSKQVQPNSKVNEVGDEPLMLKHQLPQAQVWVGSNRKQSAKLAEKAGATCILLDDGFQHWSLTRDVNIVLLDSKQGVGNSFMLPAGCLREPVSSLKRANFIISMNGKSDLTELSLNLLVDNYDIEVLKNKNVLAFSSIAIPDKFFDSLKQSGINVVDTQSFPDHHFFTDKELNDLQNVAELKGLTLVTTAKDAVKLPPDWCNIVKVNVQGDIEILMAQIDKAIKQKREK